MNLLLTGSRDQALLALLVQEAGDAVRRTGGYVGRTAIQKMMYFLQVRGVPMRYRFDIHYYGPYCDTISRDIEWLLADQVVVDDSNNTSKYSNYKPGPALGEIIALHADELEHSRPVVRIVVEALLPLSSERLELIATLHYLYRDRKATGGPGPWKERVVARFREVKQDKFPADEVRKTYDLMIDAGLLEP
jgi:uncharacterized protein YwgA